MKRTVLPQAPRTRSIRRLACGLLLALVPAALAIAGDDDGKAGSPAERDSFQIAAQAWKDRLDEQYGKDFWWYFCDDGVMPRPYLVAAQINKGADPDSLEEIYADIFGNLYRIFFEQYGELLEFSDVTDPVPVLIFDSKEAYEKVREERPKLGLSDSEFLGGYYRPWTTELIQWRQGDLWGVMFHEGTHQLVDFCARKYNTSQASESPWFQEGIAEYMGGHKRRTLYSEKAGKIISEFELGQFIQGRYSALQQGMKSGDAFSLKDLTHMTFADFIEMREGQKGSSANQVKTGMVYAQGWGLLMFLHQYDDGRFRPFLDEYFKAEIRGEGGGEAFAEAMMLETDEDWQWLEDSFREYVFTNLRQMRNKK